MNYKITFNKPYLTGNELNYIRNAADMLKLSGDGKYSKSCHELIEKRYNFLKVLLTTSCTDALEMCGLLTELKTDDEVIVPSFTFASTVCAFLLRGAKIIFADSGKLNPNVDPEHIEKLITSKTKALIIVHYAGISCDMDKILELAKLHNLFIIEDAAQAFDSYFNSRPLGSLGDLSCFSFHETKNIISGEGGMLVINNKKFINRAEILREKGTNRSAFFRGEIDKYSLVDIGSSFLPSEITAAFLYAQLENIEIIQRKRIQLWNRYYNNLSNYSDKYHFDLPYLPEYATNNGHIFYLVCADEKTRSSLIEYLKNNGIQAIFHYQSLHASPYFKNKYEGKELLNADHYSNCLIRLPMYFELEFNDVDLICELIIDFYKKNYE